MEKKLKRRADIREVIVDAARELFSRKGYHNTQVTDIIRFVGMSANTFYAHFKDKKELFEEVATGNSLTFPNVSFISAFSFTM
jgi:AcrR family transcriptional regulator